MNLGNEVKDTFITIFLYFLSMDFLMFLGKIVKI